jgi:hypothetical protein
MSYTPPRSFGGGHGNPSTDPAWNRHKHLRGEVMQLALTRIAATTDLYIGTVYRATTAKRHAYAQHRADVYRRLVTHIDSRMAAHNEHGIVFTDGNGTDPSYAAAHRSLALADRRVVVDPSFQSSRRSQWLQMADLVAFSSAVSVSA